MLLAIDAGNTNVTFGVFSKSSLLRHWRIRTEAGRTADEYAALLHTLFAEQGLEFGSIDGIVIASVVPAATPDLLRLARQNFHIEPLNVNANTDIGLIINYNPPTDIGADRLVDAAAAVHKYGAPCIFVDFGTATTVNAIVSPDEPGGLPIYLGGAICPGIGLSLEALFTRAAKLKPVEFAKPPNVIGNSTHHALQSGILYGYTAQVDGLVSRFRAEMNAPNCPVIATGGNAIELIAAESACITKIDPLLTLEGLQIVYAHNRKSQ